MKDEVVKEIQTNDATDKNGAIEDGVNETDLLKVGFTLIKVVSQMNKTLSGMIMNTYFSCILLTTTTLYTASSILFKNDVKILLLSSTACLSWATLSILRLCWITISCHNLSLSMKKSANRFERFTFKNKDIDEYEIQLLRQDLRYHSESPIAPFSAFTLSTSTLVGALGTVVTYLIVLLQFKVSEL